MKQTCSRFRGFSFGERRRSSLDVGDEVEILVNFHEVAKRVGRKSMSLHRPLSEAAQRLQMDVSRPCSHAVFELSHQLTRPDVPIREAPCPTAFILSFAEAVKNCRSVGFPRATCSPLTVTTSAFFGSGAVSCSRNTVPISRPLCVARVAARRTRPACRLGRAEERH